MRILEIQQEIPGGNFSIVENGRTYVEDTYVGLINFLDVTFNDTSGETKQEAIERANDADDKLERIANILNNILDN